ncbi:MAG: tRNA (adenosine(37)-N6)-threonylcarbamoyltransferase complex dimerization subunit type 1 TsaB, partial [Rhodospirillales bacterium]|nr:tRNA (adenosine(37)-N6)-threonylcarbamoyltransferase complex dimerization subunit type 1 TsaB [Rhodospirillales bacterium]
MKLLALDTATAACSVAVWVDGTIRAQCLRPMARGQSEALMPMVVAALAEAGLAFADLDAVAATVGPGAFTGLRIGLAAARAMALAAGLPCLGVTTLEAVAANVPEAECQGAAILVVLDAKRADLYAQVFSADLEPLTEPRAVLPADLAGLLPEGPVVVAGDAAALAVEVLAGAAQGPTGKGSLAATPLTRLFDATRPALTLASTTPDPTNTSPIPVTATFTEGVTGFAIKDVTVIGGA